MQIPAMTSEAIIYGVKEAMIPVLKCAETSKEAQK
jgi:hypothetical protein